MAESENSKFEYLKSLGQIGLFYFIGLSIFFIAGFLLISLRVSDKEKIEVPNLIGKLYLDEHNRLIETGFKVKLNRSHSLEYPFGYIISQSLSPGRVVKEGAKLVLLVNQSRHVVKTPNLVGKKYELVESLLQSIHQGRRSYRLNTGVVTYVVSSRPEGDVLAQFPPAGTPVVPESPVSLLVARSEGKKAKKKKKKKKTALLLPDLKDRNIEIVKELSYHAKLALKIETREVEELAQHGQVLEYSLSNGSKKYTPGEDVVLTAVVGQVKYTEDELEALNDEFPYRFSWVAPADMGIPKGRVTIAQLTEKKSGDFDRKKYHSFFYFENTGAKIPVFKKDQNRFALWSGYAEGVLDVPLAEPEKKAAKPEEDEKVRSVIEDIEEEKSEIATVAEPARFFELPMYEI